MTDSYDTLQLVGRHVPDANGGPFASMAEATAAGHDSINPLTGVYQIGVLIDGAFVTLLEESAGRFFHLAAHAKANAPETTETESSAQAEQADAASSSTG